MAEYSISEIHAAPLAEGARFTLGGATAFAVRQAGKDVALRIRRGGPGLRGTLARIPFVRGIARLVLGVADLIGGLSESADLEPQSVARGSRAERKAASWLGLDAEGMVAFGSGILILLILGALLFAFPMGVQAILYSRDPLPRAAENAIVCLARILGLVGSLALIPRLRVVRRLCMYQGAINKVINTYQANNGHVSFEDAKDAFLIAPRSDAAFVTLVLILSIIAFALVRTYTLPVQLLVRILIILAIAGLVNEPIQALEDMNPHDFAAPLIEPMLWLERLFVAEPHPEMVEVAVFAFNAARENDA